MPAAYVDANAAALERLRALTERLTDDDLARPIGGGWTVAATLAHMAFWDRRQQFALERWLHSGEEPGGQDADAVNDALLPLALSLEPRRAADLALRAAAAVDAAVARVSEDFAAVVDHAGLPYLLRRSQHRLDHLEQIGRAFER